MKYTVEVTEYHTRWYKEGTDVLHREDGPAVECGSHECGKNTSSGLREEVEDIKCVYLDKHGPNIVFNKDIDPQRVIDFIDKTFDLSSSTDEIVR